MRTSPPPEKSESGSFAPESALRTVVLPENGGPTMPSFMSFPWFGCVFRGARILSRDEAGGRCGRGILLLAPHPAGRHDPDLVEHEERQRAEAERERVAR